MNDVIHLGEFSGFVFIYQRVNHLFAWYLKSIYHKHSYYFHTVTRSLKEVLLWNDFINIKKTI